MIECFNKECKSKSIKIIRDFEFFDVFECQKCKYWTYKRAEIYCRRVSFPRLELLNFPKLV